MWKELAFWYQRPRMAWFREAFEFGAERIFAREAPRTWWLGARTFAADARPDQQANTLAGLHAKTVFVLLDEVSDMPAGVVQAARGIFTTVDTEAYLFVAGNPTRAEGPLYDICTTERADWDVVEITGDPDDPKRSPRIDIDNARSEIARWGRDHPVVQTNILGVFPSHAVDKLLSPDDITRAEHRDAAPLAYSSEPIIWGLDVARYGDDFSALRKRQGPLLFRGHKFKWMDGPELANAVSAVINLDIRDKRVNPDGRRPDYICVDVTGGVGASPFDHLKLLGWSDIAVPVEFASSPDDDRYANKRAEMWARAAQWTKTQGCWPTASNELGSQMCAPHMWFRPVNRVTKMLLESKEDMRKRGLSSPDDGDAFALTFAVQYPRRRDWAPGFVGGIPKSYADQSGKCATSYERSV